MIARKHFPWVYISIEKTLEYHQPRTRRISYMESRWCWLSTPVVAKQWYSLSISIYHLIFVPARSLLYIYLSVYIVNIVPLRHSLASIAWQVHLIFIYLVSLNVGTQHMLLSIMLFYSSILFKQKKINGINYQVFLENYKSSVLKIAFF